MCLWPSTGGGGRGINDGGMSVNFNYDNYDMVLIKLQTKCNTNWQIMLMYALEPIPEPSSSPPPRPQFFHALMSNNAKHPVICLLMVCITGSQESNGRRPDMLLRSLCCVGVSLWVKMLADVIPWFSQLRCMPPLACKKLVLVIFWYSMHQRMLLTMFQKFLKICSQLHFLD